MPYKRETQLGVLLGLALLTKFNLLALLPVIEIALAFAAYRQRSWKAFIRANVIVLGLAILMAGWWYLRNTLLYGEASGVGAMSQEWGGQRVPSQSIGLALSEMPYLWTSLWGRFGYGQIPLTDTLYTALFVLVIVSLAGLVLMWIKSRRQKTLLSREQVLQLVMLGLTLFLFWATIFIYATLSVNAAMGRFLFPALAGFGVLVFLGLSGWIPSRWEGGLAAGVNIALAALSVYCLVGVLAPAYARPARLSEQQIASISHPTQIVFGNQVRLLGYDVNTDQLLPGGEFILTAYWQALAPSARDLTMFVHLVSREGPSRRPARHVPWPRQVPGLLLAAGRHIQRPVSHRAGFVHLRARRDRRDVGHVYPWWRSHSGDEQRERRRPHIDAGDDCGIMRFERRIPQSGSYQF